MDAVTFSILSSVFTLVIAVAGGYLINFLKQKIGNENFNKYYNITKQVVMAIEQTNPQLSGIDKKELAIKKIMELSNNKISQKQADVLLESAVFEVKKLINSK